MFNSVCSIKTSCVSERGKFDLNLQFQHVKLTVDMYEKACGELEYDLSLVQLQVSAHGEN